MFEMRPKQLDGIAAEAWNKVTKALFLFEYIYIYSSRNKGQTKNNILKDFLKQSKLCDLFWHILGGRYSSYISRIAKKQFLDAAGGNLAFFKILF